MICIRCNKCGKEIPQGKEFAMINISFRTGFSKDSAIRTPYTNLKNSHFCKSCAEKIAVGLLELVKFDGGIQSATKESTVNSDLSAVVDIKEGNVPSQSTQTSEEEDTVKKKMLPIPIVLKVINAKKKTNIITNIAKECGCSPPAAKRVIEKCIPLRDALLKSLESSKEWKGIDIPQVFSFYENGWSAKNIAYEFCNGDIEKIQRLLNLYNQQVIISSYKKSGQ